MHSSVCGPCHQGCIERFGTSAGMWCLRNALYSLVYSVFKSSLNRLDSIDLAIILLKGDILYKEQHKSYLLSVLDLQQKFKFGKVDCLVEFEFNRFGFIVSSDSHDGLIHDLSINLDRNTRIVFFIAGFCLWILSSGGFVYLFDSQSRDAKGRHVPDSHSVLSRFINMLGLSEFINSTYFSPPMTSLQYETQLLKTLIDIYTNLMLSVLLLKTIVLKLFRM